MTPGVAPSRATASARVLPKLRFAASPTGHLKIGKARVAITNFLFARHLGGRFLLRLDDTDCARSQPEPAEAIGQDLRWLGVAWDAILHQSGRLDRYAEAAERLKRSGRLYPCFESEEELRAKREMRIRRGRPPVYDRAMLKLTAQQRAAAEAGGKRPYWRFRLSDSPVTWPDLVLGRREVQLPSVSDPVLIRADGTPLRTFASVVDDIETGITHVIRAEDHVTNTGAQLDIFAALGAAPSRLGFAHLPPLTDPDDGKLSKRLEGLTLRSLRQDGVEPRAVMAYLARLGPSDDAEPLSAEALAERFDLARASGSAARFDMTQLLALNRRVLHTLPFASVAPRLPAGATEAFWLAVRGHLDLLNEARGWWGVVAGTVVPPVIEGEQGFLRTALDLLPPEPWDGAVWTTWIGALGAATGRQGRALLQPLRLALTGEEDGPELDELLPLMGRARAARRLQVVAA
jgi:glutamyl-tRNA synthetase